MLSAICFNLDQYEILSSGNVLSICKSIDPFQPVQSAAVTSNVSFTNNAFTRQRQISVF